MVIFIITLIALAYYIEKWSINTALDGVEFDYGPSQLLAAPEEVFDIISVVTNRSGRFVPFVRLDEYLPSELNVHAPNAILKTDVQRGLRHISTVYLTPKSKLERRVKASAPARGRYIFHGAQLSGGDFLGLNEKSRKATVFREVVIYPRESGESYIMNAIGGFLGDMSVRRFIIEDPVLTVGFREYTGREPMKAISFTQSARTGRLMVKSFDYTTEPSVTVILNVEYEGGEKEALIESCYSITHTVMRILEERRIKYEFFTNATTSGALAAWSHIGEGLGERHFLTILEGLGRASYNSTEVFSATLKRASGRQNGARGFIIITPAAARNLGAEGINGQAIVLTPKEAAM